MALLASALLRDTRGFISMTTMSPFAGFSANWMFEPPVSTPIRRMHANAASRMRWYSTSVSVCAGATVIESPVCTPIASKFSIEHTTTTLSAWSRITSSSNSFQPGDRLLDEDLRHRARRETVLGDAAHLLGVRRHAGAAAAEDERRPHDQRVPDLLGDRHRVLERVRESRTRHREADLLHRRLELVAVLRGADRLDARADELDAELLEHTRLVQLDGEVERGLPAERGEQRVGALPLDDAGEAGEVERLDVGGVGELGIGHDRRRVRVHEDDAVALGLEHAARLGARVVELARLPDDDRAAPDDEDGLEVGALRHAQVPRS